MEMGRGDDGEVVGGYEKASLELEFEWMLRQGMAETD